LVVAVAVVVGLLVVILVVLVEQVVLLGLAGLVVRVAQAPVDLLPQQIFVGLAINKSAIKAGQLRVVTG
jgi:hypothetical protein